MKTLHSLKSKNTIKVPLKIQRIIQGFFYTVGFPFPLIQLKRYTQYPRIFRPGLNIGNATYIVRFKAPEETTWHTIEVWDARYYSRRSGYFDQPFNLSMITEVILEP